MYSVSFTALVVFAGFLCEPGKLHAQTLTTIYNFGGSHGSVPSALVGHGRHLFGTAQGGKSDDGVVFKLNAVSNIERTLHKFAGGADGSTSRGVLLYQAGTLYGVTEAGGSGSCDGGCGTVFSVDAVTGKHAVLYSFLGGQDGRYPEAGLIDFGGILYGTTAEGGGSACSNGCGTVFKFDPLSGSEVVLHSFAAENDGHSPVTPLTVQNGLLYGTTQLGGTGAEGTIFSVDPATGAEIVLHNFTGGKDGARPSSPLTAHDGILFGTTALGGNNCRKYGCGNDIRV